jgi:hypothetical protein
MLLHAGFQDGQQHCVVLHFLTALIEIAVFLALAETQGLVGGGCETLVSRRK